MQNQINIYRQLCFVQEFFFSFFSSSSSFLYSILHQILFFVIAVFVILLLLLLNFITQILFSFLFCLRIKTHEISLIHAFCCLFELFYLFLVRVKRQAAQSSVGLRSQNALCLCAPECWCDQTKVQCTSKRQKHRNQLLLNVFLNY